MDIEKQIQSYETLINIIEEQMIEMKKDYLRDNTFNRQILHREDMLQYFKEQQFEAMMKLHSINDFEYENLASSVLLLFKDRAYKDTIKLLKRIVKDLKKGM